MEPPDTLPDPELQALALGLERYCLHDSNEKDDHRHHLPILCPYCAYR